MRLELVTAPAAEPLTLADAKTHLRVPTTAEDAQITRNIVAARRQVELRLRRKLITQHWRIYFDSFPCASVVSYGLWPRDVADSRAADLVLQDVAPVSAIDSVKYIDWAGALQTLSTSVYQLVPEAPARVALAYGQTWPSIRGDREGVRVEVTCGYGAAGVVPEDIKAAMLLLLGHMHENREAVSDRQTFEVPGVGALLSPYVVPAF